METAEDARIVIEKLNGTMQEGKSMTVAHVSFRVLAARFLYTKDRSTDIARLVVVAPAPPLPAATTVSSSTLAALAATAARTTVATGLTSPDRTTLATTADLPPVTVSLTRSMFSLHINGMIHGFNRLAHYPKTCELTLQTTTVATTTARDTTTVAMMTVPGTMTAVTMTVLLPWTGKLILHVPTGG
jgi:hypothetical protein